jgi:putative drug exporter of the RND superfamily
VRGIADLLSKRPWALLGANLAAAAVAIAASLGAPGDLGIGSTQLDDSRPETLAVVLEREDAAGAGVLAVARDVVASQLEADPAIGAVRIVDAERRSVLLGDLEPTSAAAREDAVERISRRIDPGALRATVGGETAALIEGKRVLGEDLWRLELLVLPLVLLLAVVAVGLRVAIAPLVCTVIAIAGSAALLRLFGASSTSPFSGSSRRLRSAPSSGSRCRR